MWQHDLQLPMIIMCLIFQLELLTKEAHISSVCINIRFIKFLARPLPSDSDIFLGF
jgi:hypothetical protein